MPLGISIEVRLLQHSKALLPIHVTQFGIVTEVKPVQPLKAPSLMLVTLFGISISPVTDAEHANKSVFVPSLYTKKPST